VASTTGDGAEQAEPKAPAPTPPRPLSAPTAVEATPAVALKPASGFGPPLAPDALGAAEATPKDTTAPLLAIPPVAVPKVRTAPASQRSIKGETTASDYVAPRELPIHTPRPTESVDAKVVIDVPEGAARGAEGEAEVVEMRQRRRAPTMKIDRSKLSQLAQIDGARERSIEPLVPAVPSSAPTAPRLSASTGSLVPASVGIEGHRPLARAAPEPRSARGIGWAVVALATVVVGGGVAAIALGLVPGLGATPPSERAASPEARPAAPAPTASPTSATPAETVEPAPSAAPTLEPSAAAPASTPTPSASVPYRPPFQNGTGPMAPTVRPAPRPRPRSDIPQGI